MTVLALPGIAPPVAHPARYSLEIIPVLARHLAGVESVLDPMAGVGGVHKIARFAGVARSVGVELEPEWASAHPRNIWADACALPFPDATFEAICVSSGYGNRMADSYDGRDGSQRSTYRIDLGRPLSPGNGCALQWGDEYRRLHARAWCEAVRVLRPAGRFLLNMKDHQRDHEQQHVTDWHVATLEALGLELIHREEVPTRHYGNGANADARFPEEVVVLVKGSAR